MNSVNKWMQAIFIVISLSGCRALLPHSQQTTETPWKTYKQAEDVFRQIIPNITGLKELKNVGIDPLKFPNINHLNRLDLFRRLISVNMIDSNMLDTSLKSCLTSGDNCFAYEIEQKQINKKRIGNFWLDLLSFHKKIDITGWQFNAIIVINNERVIYKQWSGQPNIQQTEEENSPLGPLQSIGNSINIQK